MRKIKMIISALLAVALVSGIVPWGEMGFTLTSHAEETSPVMYTLTLDPNGGTIDVTTLSFEKNRPVGELPEPTRTGYVFLGWYTQKDGGKKFYSSSTLSADETLYAHWQSKLVEALMIPVGFVAMIFLIPLAPVLLATAVAPPVGAALFVPLMPLFNVMEIVLEPLFLLGKDLGVDEYLMMIFDF